MGSMNTAQVFPFLMTAAAEARSPYVASCTPVSSGLKASLYFLFAVRDSAPMVRPWKPRVKATSSCAASSLSSPASSAFFTWNLRANFRAPSFACKGGRFGAGG
eukprot:4448397-Pyramimonas_sp.AAC.2